MDIDIYFLYGEYINGKMPPKKSTTSASGAGGGGDPHRSFTSL
jgi:hypothetical protein